MTKEQEFKGKNAVITGASSGIGKAVAIRLAQDGCNIFLVARREKQLKELKKEISSLNVRVEYAVGDVTKEDFARKAILQAYETFGCMDFLVLSAGGAFIKAFNLTSTIDFRSLIEVN